MRRATARASKAIRSIWPRPARASARSRRRGAGRRDARTCRTGIVLRYGLLYGPGTWFERDERGSRRCMSMPRRTPRCSRSRRRARHLQHRRRRRRGVERQGQARTRLRCRRFGSRLERLAQEPRALQPVAPRMLHRLGDADARADDDLRLRARARAARTAARSSARPLCALRDAQRLAQLARAPSTAARSSRRRRAAAAWRQARRSAPAPGSARRWRSLPPRRRNSGTNGCRRSGRHRRSRAGRTSRHCGRCGRR